MNSFKKHLQLDFAVSLALLMAAPAAAAASCVIPPLAPLQAPVRTVSSVKTRSGAVVPFTVDVGLLRVAGGGVPYGKSVYNVPDIKDPDPPTATMSYYAFNATDAGRDRPLAFIWDGGPGSSTRPMLLNSFGPVVLNTQGAVGGDQTSNPTRPNPDTLLDVADLVFVDAPGTGFGRLEGCNAARGFYGVDVDAAAFQRFIEQFIRTHHRERSPIVLIGESYGTVRAAVVAKRLENAGTPVSRVVLISQFLSLDAWSDGSKANVGTENAFFLTLPSYAATAWWHGKTAYRGDLEPWLKQVEGFSLDTYGPALLQGANLPAERKRAVAEMLASFTGLTAKTWLDEDLRIEGSRFRYLLEAADGKLVGREDTRNEGPVPKVRGTAVEDDPTPEAIRVVNREAFKAYVRGTLKLGDRPFAPFIDGPDTRWDMHHLTDPGAWPDTYVSVAPDLVTAMSENPGLRVFVTGGYFDLAAPYFGAPYLISQLQVSDATRSRISWKGYPAPHDVYAVDSARRDMHDRIAQLIAAR